MSDCVICGRPTVDTGLVCHPCSDHLGQRLNWVADTAVELDAVLAKQVRTGDGAGRPSAETPLPVGLAAMNARDSIRNTLSGWVRIVNETRGRQWPADTIPAIARWLAGQVEWLRHREYAADAWRDLSAVPEILRRAADVPPTLTYIGPCGALTDAGQCGHDLRAVVGAATVTCPGCNTKHHTEILRDQLIAIAREMLETQSLIEHYLTAWGYPVPPETIRVWIHRDRLPKRGINRDAKPIYRIGDALDLAVRWAARRLPEMGPVG